VVIDDKYACTLCKSNRGKTDPITGKPWRNKNGWCHVCCRRGGKYAPVRPCVECGTLGGATRSELKKNPELSDRPVRYHDRCKKCYDANQRRMKKVGTKPGCGTVRKADREHKARAIPESQPQASVRKYSFERAGEKELWSMIREFKDELAVKIEESQKSNHKVDPEHESRIGIMQSIQDYRRAKQHWKAIKKYKLDVVKETESVLLSA